LDKAQQELLDSAFEQTKTIIREQKARGVRVQKNDAGFELHALDNSLTSLQTVKDEVLARFARLQATSHNQGSMTSMAFSFSESGVSSFTKEVM
ncbi:hypothetical protein, partial [Enterococcus faecium]|uniref:hypothetical protein n=1 Tax=Enterococcus faecium TaxID=1352 RepID=UPI0034E96F61